MKTFTLEKQQVIHKPLKEVFNFFGRPENLAQITPDSLNFNILTPSPIAMNVGTVIDYTIRIMGLEFHWRTLITAYDPPAGFVDEQLKGPYRFWHHRHSFIQTDEGTVVRDTVTYALPFGILGRLTHALFVKRQLQNIFDYRSEVINTILGEK